MQWDRIRLQLLNVAPKRDQVAITQNEIAIGQTSLYLDKSGCNWTKQIALAQQRLKCIKRQNQAAIRQNQVANKQNPVAIGQYLKCSWNYWQGKLVDNFGPPLLDFGYSQFVCSFEKRNYGFVIQGFTSAQLLW